ncbi:hypothetical protein [Pelagibius sp. Alg239-R121]|uniref:DUF6969 family protein n=1 Tax=Pelagibius sp. Alg239-R121 TaxID=2993448 RepID=UPI0024A632DB|nr:hypothetical protein [Pelagibius sp. Alg239-R121]
MAGSNVMAGLSKARLEDMAKAGGEVVESYRVLNKTSANVVGQVLANQGTFYEWDHYPNGDVYDGETFSQYYYHSHRGTDGENGHFHTFLRSGGMPSGIWPAPYEGEGKRPLGDDALAHIIAISMDRQGYPIALFTTNRWVTGETFYSSEDVIKMLDKFLIDHTFPCLAANNWVSSMLRLFRPQVETLLRERDVEIEKWQASHPAEDVYEDRKLEVTSSIKISVDEQIKEIHKALSEAPAEKLFLNSSWG